MFRLKLFDALMDMSKFLLVYKMEREKKVDVCKITVFSVAFIQFKVLKDLTRVWVPFIKFLSSN